jgi:aryl-alcohol dehydrogenase-like predicted oxidoreductase
VQPRYNLLFRAFERDLLPICDEEGTSSRYCATIAMRGSGVMTKSKGPALSASYGFAGTAPEATDLVGASRDAGAQLVISSVYRNDRETHELLPADVMPHFA